MARRALAALIALGATAAGLSPAHAQYVSPQTAHWGVYTWYDGTYVAPDGQRAMWLLDRSDDAEEPYWQALVNDWNGYYRQQLLARGLSDLQIPWLAYKDDDANDGACERTDLAGWSYFTACSRPSLVTPCGEGAVGCALVAEPDIHGGAYQPAALVLAGLSDPYFRKNLVTHEFGHILGLGHREWNTSSVMREGSLPFTHYLGFDAADLDAMAAIYSHAQ